MSSARSRLRTKPPRLRRAATSGSLPTPSASGDEPAGTSGSPDFTVLAAATFDAS
jgi:hypothetical protein